MPRTREWRTQPLQSLSVSGTPLRLERFVLGFEPIRESISILGGDPGRFILEPVTAAAVVYPEGWVLLDSGFNIDIVRDPDRRGSHYNYDSYTALLPPGDPLKDQVAAAGLDWTELAGCAISHLHVDHSGGLRLLDDTVPVLLQRAEWEFGITDAGIKDVYFREDYLRDHLDVVLLDGDTTLARGLTALDTAGHTPGHQSFRVDLPESSVVLACDAADLRRNITERIPCGTTATPGMAEAARQAINRLADLDELDGVQVWPGHDPEWWAWSEVAASPPPPL